MVNGKMIRNFLGNEMTITDMNECKAIDHKGNVLKFVVDEICSMFDNEKRIWVWVNQTIDNHFRLVYIIIVIRKQHTKEK